MQASGQARTEIDIVDYSVLINTALKGKTGYMGVTQRGEPSKLYEIGTWDEYLLQLGGLIAGNDFPLYCKRALEAGARLVICPIGKYANPTDKTSLLGIKAFKTITQATTAAAGAITTVTFNATATVTGTVGVIVKRPNLADITIAAASAVTSGDTVTVQATTLAAAINAGTGTHGYSAVAAAGVVTVTAPTSHGAFGRNFRLQILPSDPAITVADYNPAFTGGNDTLTNAATATLTAKAKGTAYNNVYWKAETGANQNVYTIKIRITDGTAPEEIYTDIPKLGSDLAMAAAINNILVASRLAGGLTVGSTFTFQPFDWQLAGGTEGTTPIAADYIGNSGQQTNMYAFNNSMEITKICVPALADGTLAKTLADYVDSRKDIMGLHRTPVGISPDKVLEYRMGSGSYSHAAINSWRNLMFAGGITVTDPLTLLPKDISEIGDVTGIIASKDNKNGEWWSFAGDQRGMLGNGVLGVVVNVGSSAMSGYADAYDTNGIIPVIQDAKKKIKIWGDNSLYQSNTLLKKSNVGELLVFMYRTLSELVPMNTFDPNDVDSWKSVYRRVKDFMDILVGGRALWDWKYKGDQDIMDISQAVVNKPANGGNVDAGKYLFKLYIKPKVNMKYIGVTIAVTNSGIDFTQFDETDNP